MASMRKREQKAPIDNFAVEIKCPKVVNDSSSLLKVLMINSESPSPIIDDSPDSKAKDIALAAAIASTSFEDGARLTFSARTSPR